MRILSHAFGMALAALVLLATGSPASAQTLWVPSAGGNWFDGPNWNAGIPNGVSAWARFGITGTGSQTVTVNGTATVGRITFGPTINSSNFAHTLSGGGITLHNGGLASLIERTRTDGTSDIQTPLTIAGNDALTLTNSGHPASGVSSLTPLIIGSLSGTNSTVTINPTGTVGPGVVVIQSGSYGGITNVQGSVLRAADGVGLPSNTSLRLNGGGWELPTAATITRSLGTGPGQIMLTGPQAGFTAFNGPVTIRLNNGVGQVQWGSPTFNPTTLVLGRGVTAGGSDSYTFENILDLNAATRTIALGVGAGGIRAHAVFSGNIVNNNSVAPSGLTLIGAGGGGATLELTGTNTYDGNTTVQSLNVLRANEGAGLSPNTTLVLNGGLLEGVGAATFSRNLGSAAGQVRVIGGSSGFSARGGTHTIRLNGGTGTVVWGSANFNPTTALQFQNFSSDALVDFQNGIDLNAAGGAGRFISVRNNLSSTTDVARISGVISNSAGTGAFVMNGNGVLELTGANTYTGETFVFDSVLTGGVLRLSGSGSFANSPVVTVGATQSLDVTGLTGGANYSTAAGRFQVASGQTLAGMGTVTGNALVGPGATIRGGSPPTGLNAPTGQLAVNGSLRIAGAAPEAGRGTLAVDLNGATASGATVSRVAVTGAGNVFDLDTTAGPVTIRLVNDQALTLNQPYSFVIGSSAGGFTRSGTSVTSYTHGTDFVMSSSNIAFTDVTLTVSGANDLVLGFTAVPVPEPGAVIALCAGAVGLLGAARRVRRRFAE